MHIPEVTADYKLRLYRTGPRGMGVPKTIPQLAWTCHCDVSGDIVQLG